MQRSLGFYIDRWLRPLAVCFLVFVIGAIIFRAGGERLGTTLVVLSFGAAAAYYVAVVKPALIPRNTVLDIHLGGTIREYSPRSPLALLFGRAAPSLHNLRRALAAAATDSSLDAVIVEISGLETGFATAQELHDLLDGVKQGGKRVTAVLAGDSVSARELMVACAANEIVVNPDAMFVMQGVTAGTYLLKGALDKLGVQAQALQWKEYKGVAETFSRERMSDPLRESMEALVGDLERMLAAAIADSRQLDPARTRELLAGGFTTATAARQARLVDKIGYAQDVRAEFDSDDRNRRIVSLGRYLRRVFLLAARGRRERVALVYAVGPVIAGDAPAAGEFISAAATAAEIERAARDEKTRAIVFRVSSPGGSAVGSDLVWRAVANARHRGKPVVVSMGDVAGSGGYYVAMGADAIVAEPGTLTGSIGVVYLKFNAASLLANLGVNLDFAKTTASGDALYPHRALSEAELAQLDSALGEIYGNFTAKVAEGRKLSAGRAEQAARGRVWSGLAAQAHGLVDELGGMARAVELAREKAGLRPNQLHELVSYSFRQPLGAMVANALRATETSWQVAEAGRAIGIPRDWLPALIRLAGQGGLMLLSPILSPLR